MYFWRLRDFYIAVVEILNFKSIEVTIFCRERGKKGVYFHKQTTYIIRFKGAI